MQIRYQIIIYWCEQRQRFIAEVPELPDCAAGGRTYQEALSQAEQAIRQWIEAARAFRQPIPEPLGRLLPT